MTKSCARDLTDRINSNFDDLAGMLVRARDERAWEALEYDSWTSYLNGEISVCRKQVYNLLELEDVKKNIAKSLEINKKLCTIVHKNELPTKKAQTRPLGTLEPDKQPEAWAGAVEAAGGEQPTAKQVEAAVATVKAKTPAPKPKPTAPEDKEWADALKRIGKIYGAQTVNGIEDGSLDKPRAEILAIVRLSDEQMREVEELVITARWKLSKALTFLSKMPIRTSTIDTLLMNCIAARGNYEATIDGFKITVEHVSRNY